MCINKCECAVMYPSVLVWRFLDLDVSMHINLVTHMHKEEHTYIKFQTMLFQ